MSPGRRREANQRAMIIAMVAGILLLIAGLSGMAAMETIKDFVTENVVDNDTVQIVFVILVLIASLGGIAVIVGGLLINKGKVGTGKLLITLGTGLGLIGLIVSLAVAVKEESLTIGGFLGVGAIGVILSIVARAVAE